MNTLVQSSGLTSNGKFPYNRVSILFLNFFHNFTNQIRAGIEFAHSETVYSQGGNGYNNRYQLTTQFIF